MVALVPLAALVPGAVGPARADITVQAMPSVGVGITDNAAASTTTTAPGGVFATGSVAVSGHYAGALVSHTLAYRLALTRFFEDSGPTVLTNAVAWTSSFKPTALLDIGLTASALLSRLSRVDQNDLTTVMPQASVGGTTQFLNIAVGETLSYQPTGTRTFEQELTVAQLRYIEADLDLPTSTYVLGRVRGTVLAGRNSVYLDVQLADAYTPVDPAVAVNGFSTGHTLIGRVLAGWQRELSPSWSSNIAVGPLVMFTPEGNGIIAPAGVASLIFARPPWFATLAVSQQASPNLYLGQATLNDAALARVALPLTRSDLLFVTGFAGLIYARIADNQGTLGRAFDQRTAGVALNGRLQSLPLAAELLYTIVDQNGGMIAGNMVPDFFRQTLMLNVTGVFMWGKGTPPIFGGRP